MLTIRKAITIQAWDVLYNDIFIARCDRRWEAKAMLAKLSRRYGL